MASFYVEITGIPQDFLDFLGYPVLFEDADFKILMHKGDTHMIDKRGKQYLFVDDHNDAALLEGVFRNKAKIPMPGKDR